MSQEDPRPYARKHLILASSMCEYSFRQVLGYFDGLELRYYPERKKWQAKCWARTDTGDMGVLSEEAEQPWRALAALDSRRRRWNTRLKRKVWAVYHPVSKTWCGVRFANKAKPKPGDGFKTFCNGFGEVTPDLEVARRTITCRLCLCTQDRPGW